MGTAVTGREAEFSKLFTRDSCGGHAGGRCATQALQCRDRLCVCSWSLSFTIDESTMTTRGDIYSVLAMGLAQRWLWSPCARGSLTFHHEPTT